MVDKDFSNLPYTETLYRRRGTEGQSSELVNLRAIKNGKVQFAPMGGGRIMEAPEREFANDFLPLTPAQVEKLLSEYVPTPITGDWFPEGTPDMIGYTNAQRWNGFLCPAFDKTQVEQAIADGRLANVFYFEPRDAYVTIDTMGEPVPELDFVAKAAEIAEHSYTFEHDGLEISLELYEGRFIPTMNEPVKVYDIGSFGWCWERGGREPTTTPPMP